MGCAGRRANGAATLCTLQCSIDLSTNQLRFTGIGLDLPFLPEHECPSSFTEHSAEMSPRQGEAGPSQAAAPAPPAAGASGAPAAAAAPPAPAPAAAARGPEWEEKVQRLMALGFTREQCEGALTSTGGNEDLAGSMLFG